MVVICERAEVKHRKVIMKMSCGEECKLAKTVGTRKWAKYDNDAPSAIS